MFLFYEPSCCCHEPFWTSIGLGSSIPWISMEILDPSMDVKRSGTKMKISKLNASYDENYRADLSALKAFSTDDRRCYWPDGAKSFLSDFVFRVFFSHLRFNLVPSSITLLVTFPEDFSRRFFSSETRNNLCKWNIRFTCLSGTWCEMKMEKSSFRQKQT